MAQIHDLAVQLTSICPMDSLSRSLKVPLLVSLVDFLMLSVAATGRRTGRSTTPDKTNIPNTEMQRKKMKLENDKDFSVQEIAQQGQLSE